MLPSWKAGRSLGFLVLPLLLSGLGCSKEAIKPSEDSLKIRRVVAFVDRLTQTYQAKDQAGFLAMVSTDSSELLSSLSPLLTRDFQSFDEIELKSVVDRIELDKDKVTVVLNWDGKWHDRTRQQLYKEKGVTILRLSESPALRLVSLEGDPLFGVSIRHPQIPAVPPTSGNPSNS